METELLEKKIINLKSTKEEIQEASKDLFEAMIDMSEANESEDIAKAKKIAAHYKLLKAKERLHSIEF